MAGNDKYLADADKKPVDGQPYKARHFNLEPGTARTSLHTGGIAGALDFFLMHSRNKRIAVVDDDASIRQSLERLLRIVGYSVRTFAGAQEFLDTLGSEPVHCLVADIDLGTSSGLDLADHAMVSGGKIPLIFMSGTVEDRIRSRASAAGCIALLAKPFRPIELLDAIFRATQDSPVIP